jgi:hypothetical protein
MNYNFIKNWKPQYWGYVFLGYYIVLPMILFLVAIFTVTQWNHRVS